MACFNVSVTHGIGREAALARMRPFLDALRRDYAHEISDIQGKWHDNKIDFTFTARGLQVQGTLAVEEDAVHVSGPLQLAVLIFRNRIEATIRRELEKLLR